EPAVDLEVLAQALDVRDEMLRGVVLQLAERRGAAGSALIEYDDTVVRRIEEAPVRRRRAGAGSAVEKEHRSPVRVPALLPVHGVRAVEPQLARAVRLYLGVEFRAW